MSRSSISTASKIPTKLPARSAWAKGPPQSPTISPRSQSPATPTPVYTHSRRSSTLGEGVPINDGVSVPHSNAGTVKQGKSISTCPQYLPPHAFPASPASAVSFNSVGDVHAARYSNLPPPQQLSPSQLPQMSSGSGPVPRSRQLPSGNDTRPESGPDGGPVQAPVEPSRPRLGSHPQSGRSSGVPLPPPQLQPQVVAPGSPGYYVSNVYPRQAEERILTGEMLGSTRVEWALSSNITCCLLPPNLSISIPNITLLCPVPTDPTTECPRTTRTLRRTALAAFLLPHPPYHQHLAQA